MWRVILLASVLLTWRAAAEPPASPALSPAPDLTELSLEELAGIRVATVYGASKHEQAVSEAPSSVSIVTRDEIQKSGYRTLAEIINSVRGFYTTWDRGYSFIGVRGFNRPGDYGGRILITVNGHRMNDPVFDSASSHMDFILDVDLIDRVEVIRGPGSSLYGNNAFFGVINVVTRDGKDLDGFEASGSYGSLDTYTGRFSYGQRFESGLDLAVSGTYYDSAGHDRLYFPEFDQINNGYAEDADSAWAGSVFLSADYHGLRLEGGYVHREKLLPTAAYGTVFNDPRSEVKDDRAFANVGLRREFGRGWELTARGYYDHLLYEADGPFPEFGYDDPAYPGRIVMNLDYARSESAGGELQLVKAFGDRNRVLAGAEYRYDFQLDQSNRDLDPPEVYFDESLTADTLGIYGQAEVALLRSLTLNAGLRYDYFSSFGDTVNPRAALIHNPWTNTTLKLIYGQAFRAPNAFELYYAAPGYAANPDLQPETIHSYEFVIEQRVGEHLELSAGAFYNDIDDLITFQPDGEISRFENLESATARGADLGLTGVWGGWRVRLGYTYSDARDDDDERLTNAPEHVGKLNLTAPLWADKLFANLELLALSERRTVRSSWVSGYFLVNGTLFSRELVRGLEISASVYNLFAADYSDPVSSDFLQEALEQDGRMFRVKLTYRF